MQILESTKNSSPNPIEDQILHILGSAECLSLNPDEDQSSHILRSPVQTPPTINKILSKKKFRWRDQMISKRQIRKRQVQLKRTSPVKNEAEVWLCALEKLLSNTKPHERVNLENQQCDEIREKKQ